MTQLTFTQASDGSYVCETTANSAFAIHIELSSNGTASVELSSLQNGEYEPVYTENAGKVFDKDFNLAVFPKYLRIVVNKQPFADKCYIIENSAE